MIGSDREGEASPDGERDCREVWQLMYEYLDQELSVERREEVREHLDDCSPCLEAFEFEAELKQVIARRCKDEVPAHLYTRVRMSLRGEIEGNPPKGGIPPA